MKHLLMVITLLVATQSQAFDWMGSIKKYALPCAATAGASFLVLKEHRMEAATLGCSFLVIGSEMIQPEPLSDEKLAKMDELFTYKINENERSIKQMFEEKLALVDQKIATEDLRTKELVKNVMTDVAILMEAEVYKKVQAKLKELEFVSELKKEMIERIKEEVIAEMKSRKGEIEDAVVEKVIKRVTAEPITVESSSSKSQQK